MKAAGVRMVAVVMAIATRSYGAEPGRAYELPRHRAMVGLAYGFSRASAELNGRVGVEEDAPGDEAENNGGLVFVLEERFTKLFSLALRGGFTTWDSSWSEAVGYKRRRLDFGLEPRIWLRAEPTDPTPELYLGLGGGLSQPFVSAPERRTYDEHVEGPFGYYFAGSLGTTLSWRTWGLFCELSYALHRTHLDATLEPKVPGASRTLDELDYVDHAVLLSAGVLAGF
ncbi:MAG TPA: hypothetical protein VFZ53_32725 [Polyangiaceae bacterium]